MLSIFLPPLSDMCTEIFSAVVDGRLSRGSSVHKTGSEQPPRHQRKFSISSNLADPIVYYLYTLIVHLPFFVLKWMENKRYKPICYSVQLGVRL